MPTAVWTGSISFGMVNIPVRMFPATSPKDPRFRQIDRQTGRRVRLRRVVEDEPDSGPTGEESRPTSAEPLQLPRRAEHEVSYDDIVKGYEVDKGQHVILEPEEVEQLRPERSRTIDIERFVALEAIDPVYFEKSYHLAPQDANAVKPYALLLAAMERAGRVAIGRFVLRTREHLVAIRPTRGILGLETLFYADELREPPSQWLTAPSADASSKEIEMAEKLIAVMAADWEPESYRDTFRERVMQIVEGREPAAVAEPPPGPKVPDLMEALKASVEASTKRKASGSGRRRGKGAAGR